MDASPSHVASESMADAVDLGPTGGVVWSDPTEWARRKSREGCVICRSGKPLDVIAETAVCWVTAPKSAPLPGYVCVVSKRHVNEPFELSPAEQCLFWRDAMTTAEAVASVVSPIKMNYEIHGNTLPHFHMHLFPREPVDPMWAGPSTPGLPPSVAANSTLDGSDCLLSKP
jgi:diadenosine tetraphosphate (Ap4A) HIT family hydrolase